MTRLRVRAAVALAVGLIGGLLAIPLLSGTAGAAPQTVVIGVDHAAPSGHNWLYVDFFPRTGVNIHSGDTIDFQWATAPDGFHTATLLKTGETPQQAWQTVYPLATPDSDDSSSQLQLNPAIVASTNPPAGSGAPGACGNATTPCTFSGSSDLNSGGNPTAPNTDFFVNVTAPAGTYNIVCLIHAGMAATFTVVDATATASTPSDVTTAANSQATADTNEALAAEAAAPPSQVTNNADGTHTVTATAGTASAHVEVAEMLPQNLSIKAGDTIKWTTSTIKDVHTVTFPQGSDPSTEPLPFECEAGPPDAVQPGPPTGPGPPCGDPTKFENHLDPAPVGPTTLAGPTTNASSGILATPPAPFPTNYSFKFASAGSYTYQCRIHDHMTGTVTVLAATITAPAPPATPVAGRPSFTG